MSGDEYEAWLDAMLVHPGLTGGDVGRGACAGLRPASWPAALARGRTFFRERPLHRRDLDELGVSAPTGPVLVASVPDEGAKAALLAAEPDLYFTTAHFAGWSAVLVRLERLDATSLRELAAEAWAARAPRRLVDERPLTPPTRRALFGPSTSRRQEGEMTATDLRVAAP